jgi:pyrroline-5-carboxylate reductase
MPGWKRWKPMQRGNVDPSAPQRDNLAPVNESLAIIGAGNMAEAIARAVLRAAVMRADQFVAADVSAQRRDLFLRELGVRAVESAAEAVRGAGMILLSVKPQQVPQVLLEIAPEIADDALVISIAAGVSTATIESVLAPKRCRVIRTMPNTPVLVGAGAVAIAPGTRATGEDVAVARRLFEPAAVVIDVTEDKLDAVTALSGSGPAYFFLLVEAMTRAGLETGLSLGESRTLAVQTAIGSGKMLGSADVDASELRRRVTSPGGTTEAAIKHMQEHELDRIVIDAIKAARDRGRELGRSTS